MVDQCLQGAALGAPPVAVVDQAGVAWHEVVLEVRHFAVEAHRLDGAVRLEQDGAAGRPVAAARLHADIAVLDQVEAADAVFAADLIQRGEQLVGLHLLAVEGDGITLPEFEIEVLGLVRRLLRRHRPAPHRLLGLRRRVFQVAAFVGDMQQIGVHGIG